MSASSRVAPAGSTTAPPVALTGLRVMVVEDEALIAMLLAEVLTSLGCEICAIEATEAGAVAAARRCRPGLMIVDARLRQGSGLAAIEQILRTGFIPHVVVTGETLAGIRLKPGTVMIQKPFREPDLVRAIGRALAAAGVMMIPGSGSVSGPLSGDA